MAKADADLITISGHDGGTGASPLTSIHYAGMPWELGLAETHADAARAMACAIACIVQTDGGLKTGLDVIKAAMLGAECFGFGTAPMVALGCKYLRICHLNSARPASRRSTTCCGKQAFRRPCRRWSMNFFRFVAEDVRARLAQLGVRSARRARRPHRSAAVSAKASTAEAAPHRPVAPLLAAAGFESTASAQHAAPARATVPRDPGTLAARIADDTRVRDRARARGGEFRYRRSRNTDRTIGARLSGDDRAPSRRSRHGDAPIELQL